MSFASYVLILTHSYEIFWGILLLVFNPKMFCFITFIQTIFFGGMPQVKATSVPTNITSTPSSPRMPFSVLLSSIRDMVPSRTMFLIDVHYALLMVCK